MARFLSIIGTSCTRVPVEDTKTSTTGLSFLYRLMVDVVRGLPFFLPPPRKLITRRPFSFLNIKSHFKDGSARDKKTPGRGLFR